jgi:hypothetical protein
MQNFLYESRHATKQASWVFGQFWPTREVLPEVIHGIKFFTYQIRLIIVHESPHLGDLGAELVRFVSICILDEC